MEKVFEKVTRQPVYKRKDDFAEIMQKLSTFVETNRLKITQLKFTQRSGTFCFKVPGLKKEKENAGGVGCSYGSDDSSSGGLSRRKRRECREAQRNNSNKNSASSDLSSSSGYSTENINHATDNKMEGLKEQPATAISTSEESATSSTSRAIPATAISTSKESSGNSSNQEDGKEKTEISIER